MVTGRSASMGTRKLRFISTVLRPCPNGAWERSSRTNIFRRVRFFFLRGTNVPFRRTFLQSVLSKALPMFIMSSADESCCTPRGSMKEVVDSFRFLAVRFLLEHLATVSRKALTEDLRDVLLPVPLCRSVQISALCQDGLSRVKRWPSQHL